MSNKIQRQRTGGLMARDQLEFMVKYGEGLWDMPDGLMVYYYTCPKPLSVFHYIGALRIEEKLPGIPPAEFDGRS